MTRGTALRTAAFFKFGGLSGLGWLLDFTILLCLVSFAGMPGFAANIVSSLIAAGSVFVVSRYLIFESAAGGTHLRLAAYLLYTLAVILVASLALGLIVWVIDLIARRFAVPLDATLATALAKIVITPPQLVLNFFMSRHLNERPRFR